MNSNPVGKITKEFKEGIRLDTFFFNIDMIKRFFYTIIFLFLAGYSFALADNYEDAEYYIYDAENAVSSNEKYENIYQARKIYQKLYKQNPKDIKALLGLAKTYKMTDDAAEAKIYVLKAYNLKPLDPAMQRELGDFYYYTQEYSTAIHYYNKALSSGYLLDFYTNYSAAKCYAKLGEIEQAKLYYQVCNYIDPDFLKYILNKEKLTNDVDDDSPLGDLDNAKPVPEPEPVDESDIEPTIEEINKVYVIPEHPQNEDNEQAQKTKKRFNFKFKRKQEEYYNIDEVNEYRRRKSLEAGNSDTKTEQ